jgi:soluble lytic murein transglycosylase
LTRYSAPTSQVGGRPPAPTSGPKQCSRCRADRPHPDQPLLREQANESSPACREATGHRHRSCEIAVPIFGDLGENGDPDALVGLGELASRNGDARGMLLLGKAALNRGLPFDFYAYPVNGIPPFKPIGPDVEQSIVYAIARQESAFNPAVVSPAQAYGLMQVTPDAGRYVCKRAGVSFDLARMKNDPVYNAALGAAELGGLIEDYRGSYIMTFAAYNAGRGSVKKWVERYSDPRDPKVDAVDWVELIPFSETRNYVQRIMENLQVYRARFGGGTRLQIEADLHRGASVE